MRLSPALAFGLLLALLAGSLTLSAGRVLAPAASGDSTPAEVQGCVRDGHGPVAGARVRLKGTAVVGQTDAAGRFHLQGPAQGRHVTAWKEGYLIAGARPGRGGLELHLDPLPARDHEGYRWVDPTPGPESEQRCGSCHGAIFREWLAGGHSRSATGRHFRNLYEGTNWDGRAGVGWGLLTQYPDGAGVCTSCHAPAVADSDPALLDLRRLQGVAARGVHCDYCHKIAGVGDGTLGLTHGRYNLLLLRPARGQLFFGPLDDVDRGEDAYSPLYHDSRYCASCHEGVVFGVHVYSTYSEWRDSPARRQGKQCQDCHMAPTGHLTNLAPDRGGLERDPRTLGSHRLFQGSQAQMLRACVRVSAVLRDEPRGVRARVRIWVEGVGHRVPTGFVDRHLLLVVEGRGPDGTLLPARGPVLPPAAGRELAGQPGRLYAKLLRDDQGRAPAPFWRADPEAQDTRLTPGQADETSYRFPVRPTQLRVRVLYRRFWKEVARAKGWPDRDLTIFERTFPVTPRDSCPGKSCNAAAKSRRS